MINYLFLLFILLSSSFSYAQTQNIAKPEIIGPEEKLIGSYYNKTEESPVLFNGKVHTIHKKLTQELQSTTPISTNFYYTFDKNKQLQKYDSDHAHDTTTISDLNLEKTVSITGDTTIISNEGSAAIFKKGHLQYILSSSIDNYFYENNRDNVTDSIAYQYKKDKLVGIYHYSKDVAETMDGSYLVAEYYDLNHYKKARYNDKNQLASIVKGRYEIYEDHFIKETSTYKYNEDALLHSYLKVQTEYEMGSLPEGGIENIKTEDLKKIESQKHQGILDYFQGNTKLTINDAETKKNIQEYRFEEYKSRNSILYSEKGLKIYEYDIVFDQENNPTEISIFSYVNQKKVIDEIITFTIDYY